MQITETTICITEPLLLPLAEQEQYIRDLELEVADLQDLVREMLKRGTFPRHMVISAYRLIGEYQPS
jgi:hypothetical protein